LKNKVLHIIDNLCLGGAQRIVLTLVNENPNHELHYLRKNKDQMHHSEEYSFTDSSSKYNLKGLIDCLRFVKEYEPDIVHCHLLRSKITGLKLKLISRKDFKLVMHEHGEIWKDNHRYNVLLRYGNPLIDCHIAVSEHTSKLLQRKASVPKEKIKTVYNFVDRDEYNPEVLESFESDLNLNRGAEFKDSFKVGYGGRLEERKGWETLVDVAERIGDMEFLISGSGTGEEILRKKSNEIDNLYYLGFLEDVRTLFANVDCLVLPSKWDPSPMILYEAQSCGVPLICTDTYSINEIVEDSKNTLMFEPSDTENLIDLLNKVRDDQQLKAKLSSNGVSNAKKFSYKAFRENLENVYRDLTPK